ncbi:mitochondrial carrier protein Mtm1p [Monosporozyma unispora]|nr:hypothetical protein C6P44_001402 [Kazachstania unispora]
MSADERILTVTERMISATTGSLLTSIMLTPMDVVRIRLQQQGMLPECVCEPAPIESPSKNLLSNVSVSKLQRPLDVPTPLKKELFWESSCFADLKCNRSALRFNGIWDAISKIAANEGPSTLWRGISLTLFMSIPANIVYFTGYEYIRDKSPLKTKYPMINPLICGGLARIVAATTVAPIELIKTKFQSIPRSQKQITSTKMFRELLEDTGIEIKQLGVTKALFKGLTITLWRDVPFSAIYWGSYEFCKRKIWFDNLEQKNWIHFSNSFISGSISGIIAAICTHPFDVGKTRLQISMIKEPVNKITSTRRNMFKYLNIIRQNEGIGALYTGLGARIVKIAPSCAIMISTYEISKKFFDI